MNGFEPWGMYDHIKRYSSVLEIHRYNDTEGLIDALEEMVIAPAMVKAKELENKCVRNSCSFRLAQ